MTIECATPEHDAYRARFDVYECPKCEQRKIRLSAQAPHIWCDACGTTDFGATRKKVLASLGFRLSQRPKLLKSPPLITLMQHKAKFILCKLLGLHYPGLRKDLLK